MKYSIYISSGEIVKNIDCLEDQINIQLSNDQQYIKGNYQSNQYYIQNELPILIPSQPLPYSVFNYTTKTWEQNYTIADKTQKKQRNKLLYDSDWTQIPNNPLTADQQTAWATYRQALRDITTQIGYPFEVVWPTAPN